MWVWCRSRRSCMEENERDNVRGRRTRKEGFVNEGRIIQSYDTFVLSANTQVHEDPHSPTNTDRLIVRSKADYNKWEAIRNTRLHKVTSYKLDHSTCVLYSFFRPLYTTDKIFYLVIGVYFAKLLVAVCSLSFFYFSLERNKCGTSLFCWNFKICPLAPLGSLRWRLLYNSISIT